MGRAGLEENRDTRNMIIGKLMTNGEKNILVCAYWNDVGAPG
jgi:hypothetical protein